MNHVVSLQFEDGASRVIRCGDSEAITDAAYRQKVNVPMDCRDGVCGTCKAMLESGTVDMGDYLEEALSEEEAAQGYVLACQCRPRSDCVLRIAASSAACKLVPLVHEGVLSDVRPLSDTAILFTVTLAEPAGLAFLPGQYVHVQIPGTTLTRAYSFCSPPGAADARFLVRNVPGGRMSTMLQQHAGQPVPIRFTGPYGSFYLRDIRRPLLMLAGGTGLAPFLSMLDLLASRGTPPAFPIHLVFGVTRDVDLVALDRLAALARALPGFSFATCVADPNSAQPLKGYVTGHITPEHLNGGDVDVYLCGPPAMVDAVRDWMDATGVKTANFYTEKFSLAVEEQAA